MSNFKGPPRIADITVPVKLPDLFAVPVSQPARPPGVWGYEFNSETGRRALERLLPRFTYKPDWRFRVADYGRGPRVDFYGGGPRDRWYLEVSVRALDSQDPTRELVVTHCFQPPQFAAPDEGFWRRWLLDRVLEVERHEAMEFFRVDGAQPFYPHHEPGADPYAVEDRWTGSLPARPAAGADPEEAP